MIGNTEFLKKQIESLDVKSDQFFDLYKVIWDKYWDDDAIKDNDYMKAAKVLSMFAERYDTDYVILAAHFLQQLHEMKESDNPVCMGTLGFSDREFIFKIGKTEKDIDDMEDKLGEIQKAMESGKVKIKNKGKKRGPFGGKFF